MKKNPKQAKLNTRMIAALIDYSIISTIYFLFMKLTPTSSVNQIIAPFQQIFAPSSVQNQTLTQLFVSLNISIFFTHFWYNVTLLIVWGNTIGKSLMKIRIVSVNNKTKPSVIQLFIRETFGKFLSLLPFGLGIIAIFVDSKKQTWHDKLTKTVVISNP